MMTDRLHMTKMTWMDYARCTDRPIILPVGSTEQHGPHLPLGVDSIIAENFAALLAQRIDAVVAPTLSYGYKSKPFSGARCRLWRRTFFWNLPAMALRAFS